MRKFVKIILGVIILLELIIGGAGFYITRGLDSQKNMDSYLPKTMEFSLPFTPC